MDMKSLFKTKKANFDLKSIFGKISSIWMRFYQLVFIVFFLAMAGIGVYFWYVSLYRSGWSEEKKNQYISTKQTEVSFKEDDFKTLMQEIENRKAGYKNKLPPIKNIFEPLK